PPGRCSASETSAVDTPGYVVVTMVPFAAMRRVVALLAIAALGEASAPAPHGFAAVAALLRQRTQDAGIVGSGLMFVKDGAVAAQAFEGYQDLEPKRPI